MLKIIYSKYKFIYYCHLCFGKSSSCEMVWIDFMIRGKQHFLRSPEFWRKWKEKEGRSKAIWKKLVEALIKEIS